MPIQLIQGGMTIPAPRGLAAKAQDAWDRKLELDRLGSELETIKAEIQTELEGSGTLLSEGEFRITAAPRTSNAIADVDGLRKALGQERFLELVTSRTSFGISKNLELILDDVRHPDHAAVKAFISASTVNTISIKAEKPAKEK